MLIVDMKENSRYCQRFRYHAIQRSANTKLPSVEANQELLSLSEVKNDGVSTSSPVRHHGAVSFIVNTNIQNSPSTLPDSLIWSSHISQNFIQI
jgi:K+-transporting ATPase A subunit